MVSLFLVNFMIYGIVPLLSASANESLKYRGDSFLEKIFFRGVYYDFNSAWF